MQFLGSVGNVFDPRMIDKAIESAKNHIAYQQLLKDPKLQIGYDVMFYLSCDVGFSSSAFAIILVVVLDDKICVLESIELEKQLFATCINRVSSLMVKYNLNTSNTKILVDASSPSVVTAIKSNIGVPIQYAQIMEYRKKQGVRDITSGMTVIPVTFTATERRICY